MTGYKRVNYYELCRLCTSSQPKDKIHIFREEGRRMQLQQKIQSCFPLLVCEDDYLPKVVCNACILQLEQCYVFRQNCINSETMLSSYFSNFRFTDDFKKAGKVYVKDTGQKPENSPTSAKKNTQENNINQQNLVVDMNQQFFTLELPALPTKQQNIPKITVPNTQNTLKLSDFQTINQQPANLPLNTIKPSPDIKYNSNTNMNAPNLISCNLTSLNFNSNVISPKFDQKNNIEPSTVEFNILKQNVVQPMMLIDVEQLIESGLPESEVSKLKEALMKPNEVRTKQNHKENECTVDDNALNAINDLNSKAECQINGNKNFKCEICDRVFKRREHLYQHSKLHTGLRPFSCGHCSKTFSRKEHLIRHLTSHSGIKDFSCDICNKKFSRPDNLKKHKKTHQKSGPYVCDICQKSFVIKHYYVAHKLHHTNEGAIINILKIDENNI